jgi:hypothetical protein
MVYEWFAMCTLVRGWLDHAASWLMDEWWYVGTVVLKGGVGCLLSMVMQFGGDPGTLTVLRALTLCCATTRLPSMLVVDIALAQLLGGLFFINVGASHVCSSHNNYVVFSPKRVRDHVVFVKWCF